MCAFGGGSTWMSMQACVLYRGVLAVLARNPACPKLQSLWESTSKKVHRYSYYRRASFTKARWVWHATIYKFNLSMVLINTAQKKLKELLGEPREPFEVLAPLKTRGSPNTGKYCTIGSRNSSTWSHWGSWGSHTMSGSHSATWLRRELRMAAQRGLD